MPLAEQQPAWGQKHIEGKMFQKLDCGRCGTRFHFADPPRVTRIPRCPRCGSMEGHLRAA